MLNELEKAPLIYQPSNFWKKLNKVHLDQLFDSGINNFKRSVNMKYFNWRTLGIIRHQMSVVLAQLKRGNFDPVFRSSFKGYVLEEIKNVKSFNSLTAFIYKAHVASFADYIFQNDNLHLLNTLSEPPTGNPFVVEYKGKLISQDLCNSIHEFYSIVKYLPASKKLRIAELGSGYGRLGHVFLKALPKSDYCFIDIPPALFIAQFYISKIFPNEKIFKFRQFSSFKEVKKEFEESRIRFLMPHQIELLPKKYFDLFINISSLHEMRRDQIKNYIKQVDKLTSGLFYIKEWRKSRTKDNLFIKQSEYPIPKKWKTLFIHNRHPIQKMFFDALYRIK